MSPPMVVILAGGEGRRMGGGKPGRAFGNITLLARAVELASSWSPNVVVALRSAGQAPAALAPDIVLDAPHLEGPIAGLAAALAHAANQGAERLMTLPCDAPWLPSDLAARLDEALPADGLCAVAASGGRRHPTCALWRTKALDRLEAYLATGRRSLNGFAEACAATDVVWEAGARDPFANANTPDELASLQPD